MDVETTLNGCFNDLVVEPSLDLDPSSKALSSCASTACFDCNICLEFAADPVVTLCGHLYCWPCIFRWLDLGTNHRHCPVCKSSLSESSLVPLYGRGLDSKQHDSEDRSIPDRPRDHRKLVSQAVASDLHPPLEVRQGATLYQNHQFYGSDLTNHVGVLHSNAGVLLGEFAFAMLPRVFRNQEDLHTSLNQSATVGRRNQRCRQELMVESWMNQLWIFLFCCAVMCLVCF
ncbi:E3 ubiquitin-protein ligase RMA3-like [Phalaenopsis equestris]|uniref:E3 ubiquitin-protein ligase RMA3-like n=1 Tax=Phalaenopsis equestris TaxID=78828 RepID=UPI0009E1D6C7|nr:E3 ubiquitin-protein ligase RMA3-like [Phalaenopsis equestris]